MVTPSEAATAATARPRGPRSRNVGETGLMADQTDRDSAAERVAETVRRALALVGPSEGGVERLADEEPAEAPGV
jgi:hypothetical protein